MNKKSMINQNPLDTALKNIEMSPHDKNLNFNEIINIFDNDDDLNKNFFFSFKNYGQIQSIYHGLPEPNKSKDLDQYEKNFEDLMKNYSSLVNIIETNKSKITNFTRFLNVFKELITIKIHLFKCYDLWFFGRFPINFDLYLSKLENCLLTFDELIIEPENYGLQLMKESISYETECHHHILFVLKCIENMDFWGAIFPLTKLKFLTSFDKQKSSLNLCVECEFSPFKFFKNFHKLLTKKVYLCFSDIFLINEIKPIEEVSQPHLKEILDDIIFKDLNGFLVIFSKKNNFQEKNYNSSLCFIKNNYKINKDLLTIKDYTIIFSTKKKIENEFDEIIVFMEESEEVIESYLNKERQNRKNENEFVYMFISKISNQWYLSFYAKNLRGVNESMTKKKVNDFAEIWRNKHIFN